MSKSRKQLFATDKNGFATLDISKNKNVNVDFYTVDTTGVKKAYSSNLLNFTGFTTQTQDTLREVEVAFKDSVIISASDKYKNPTGFKKTFLGNNYRKEWGDLYNLKYLISGVKKEGLK